MVLESHRPMAFVRRWICLICVCVCVLLFQLFLEFFCVSCFSCVLVPITTTSKLFSLPLDELLEPSEAIHRLDVSFIYLEIFFPH